MNHKRKIIFDGDDPSNIKKKIKYENIPGKNETIKSYVEYIKEDFSNINKIPKKFQNNNFYNMLPKDDIDISKVDPRIMTEHLCCLAIDKSHEAIKYIPEHLFTEKVCRQIIRMDPLAITCIPPDKLTADICISVLEKNPNTLHTIMNLNLDQHVLERIIVHQIESGKHFSFDILTPELCLGILKRKSSFYKRIPARFRTPEFHIKMVKNFPLLLSKINTDELTKEICDAAFESSVNVFRLIPLKFTDENMILKAIEADEKNMIIVPEDMKTPKIFELGIKKTWSTIKYIPNNLLTEELAIIALLNSDRSYSHIPQGLQIKKYLYNYYCTENYKNYSFKEKCLWFLKNIPESLMTEKIYDIMVNNDNTILNYIPSRRQSKSFTIDVDAFLDKIITNE